MKKPIVVLLFILAIILISFSYSESQTTYSGGVGGGGNMTSSGSFTSTHFPVWNGSAWVDGGAPTAFTDQGSYSPPPPVCNTALAAIGACSTGSIPAVDVAPVSQSSGTGTTLAGPAQFYECTTTCTVTAPVPPATGTAYQFCVSNDDNVNTVITLAMPASVMIEAQARTSYGTAGTGHGLTSNGAVANAICFHSKDGTHYNIDNAVGTWTAY